jgi:tripeptide aminopeptidase
VINESRLVQTFLDLVAIDSPSGQEQAIADDLVRRFAALGGEVVRDEHHNLIARFRSGRFPNGRGEWLMLSAHMDTVGADVGIKPQIRDGIIFSDGTTILGGDDKSGVAIILEVIRSLQEEGAAHPPLEAVISVSEEIGLQGARWLDKGQIRSRSGVILDGGGPLNNIVVSAPSQDSLRVTVFGRKAHAGSEPEKGINAIRVASEAIAAMPLGRIDEETTANIGVIQGGTATNIVPDEVFIRGEARSRNDEKLAKQTAAMVSAFEEAAERNSARVEVKIQRSYNSYTLTEATPVVAKAMTAIRQLGQTPALKASGGGTDGNIYAEHGIYCCVLSTGMSHVHTTNENIAISAMVACARLVQDIVANSE